MLAADELFRQENQTKRRRSLSEASNAISLRTAKKRVKGGRGRTGKACCAAAAAVEEERGVSWRELRESFLSSAQPAGRSALLWCCNMLPTSASLFVISSTCPAPPLPLRARVVRHKRMGVELQLAISGRRRLVEGCDTSTPHTSTCT